MNVSKTQTYQEYGSYIKPSWAPPNYLFGPVWTFLYFIIFLTFGYVFKEVWLRNIPAIVAVPFVLNLIFNFSFTYFQFGLKNNFLASLDIILVLITLVWLIAAIYKFSPVIAYFQIPYLLWVSFATVLQLTITYLNK